MADTTFQIGIGVEGAGAVADAANAVDRMGLSLEGAGVAASAASAAVKLAERAYAQAEAAADKTTKALEKNNIALDLQRTKLAAASQAGDASAIKRAEDALAKLNARQLEAVAAAEKAKLKLTEEASALDKLKAAEDKATAAKAKAQKANDAAKASMGSGKVNEMAEAFGKLGGPVGAIGQKLFGAADGVKKLFSSMGSAGAMAGVAAIGIGAVVLAIAAVSAAAIAGVVSILKWSIALSDKNKDIDKQTTRLSDNFKKMFSGLKIGGVIDGLKSVANLFEENSASAKAIKTVFESLFQPLVDGISAAIPMVVRGFIQLEIYAMKALIAIKPFGPMLLLVLEGVGIAFAAIAANLILVIGVIVVNLTLMAATFGAVVYAIYKVGEAIFGGIGKAIDWLKTLSLSDIGKGLIEGLVIGITGAGPALISSITGLAGSAITAAKKALGIASPSTVFAEIGVNTAEGMVQGVDDTAPAVQGSLESMVAPPEAGAAPASASGASSGVNLSNVQFVFNGVAGAEDAEGRIRKVLIDVLEGNVAQLGAAA